MMYKRSGHIELDLVFVSMLTFSGFVVFARLFLDEYAVFFAMICFQLLASAKHIFYPYWRQRDGRCVEEERPDEAEG